MGWSAVERVERVESGHGRDVEVIKAKHGSQGRALVVLQMNIIQLISLLQHTETDTLKCW